MLVRSVLVWCFLRARRGGGDNGQTITPLVLRVGVLLRSNAAVLPLDCAIGGERGYEGRKITAAAEQVRVGRSILDKRFDFSKEDRGVSFDHHRLLQACFAGDGGGGGCLVHFCSHSSVGWMFFGGGGGYKGIF